MSLTLTEGFFDSINFTIFVLWNHWMIIYQSCITQNPNIIGKFMVQRKDSLNLLKRNRLKRGENYLGGIKVSIYPTKNRVVYL